MTSKPTARERSEWFFAEGRNGEAMYGIRCSHGFVKYTSSREAAEACVDSWNKQRQKIDQRLAEGESK